MKKLMIVLCWVFVLHLSATIINVPANQPTIQAGINASANGDTVLVQPDSYIENINFNGKNITVASLFLTTQDTSFISQTIIDGNQDGSVVTLESGENSTAILSGFTITNGYTGHGGGILCNSASPKLENLLIYNNYGSYGGGIQFNNSNSILINSSVNNNNAAAGGAIICWFGSDIVLMNVIINNNISNDDGGGLNIIESYINLTKVRITNNTANDKGGGLTIHSSVATLNKVTISNNSAYYGGGIYDFESTNDLLNCVLWNNEADDVNEIYGSASVNYSDIQGGWAGTGNIDTNPQFVDSINGNYHIIENSPCIDAGDPDPQYNDLDGTRADMGYYYYNQFFADFSAIPILGYSPLVIDFIDASGAISENWFWDFQNDGIYDSFEQNPTFTYTEAGIYDVKLKISNATQVDSLIKFNYITVEYVPPAPPTNIDVNISGDDAIISWTAVDTTIFGNPIIPNGYVVRYNESANIEDEFFYFLAFTTNTTYTHEFVAHHSPQMFYSVVAYIDLSRNEIDYLENLNNSFEKIKWSEVIQNLNKMRK